MSTCPTDKTLARISHDSFDGGRWSAVEAHVQDCVKCQELMDKMTTSGTAAENDSVMADLPSGADLPRIPGFEIEAEVGRGGMGVVYRAWDTKLARTVALKIVAGGPTTSSRERRHWLSEARCVTRVNHPNIVKIHDADEYGGWLYLVLEFVPGGSLSERARGPLPPQDAAELMKTVSAAIAAVHQAGLLHLDLNPSNILLDSPHDASWKNAAPRVADFGISLRLADRDTSLISMPGPWGTPSYMAPEQVSANRAAFGHATDVYALGAILYKLLTGRPPFLAASPGETFDQIRNDEPVPPRHLNRGVPRDLDTICLRCLNKDPRNRYPSPAALADDLDRFLEGRVIKARPVSVPEHAWRWCRRRPVITALAATLILTLIASSLGLWMLLRRSEALRARSEANYHVASRSLDELLRVFSNEDYEHPWVTYSAGRLKILETARLQELELSKRYSLDVVALKRLVIIDRYLWIFYLRAGKQDKAQSLIEETVDYCEACLALDPADAEIQQIRFKAATGILAYISPTENDQLYEHWNARAIAMLERSKLPESVHLGLVCGLSFCHRRHTDSLILRGDLDRARQKLEEDLGLLRSVPIVETAYPEYVLSEALTLAALGRWSGEGTSQRSSTAPKLPIFDLNVYESGLAELTARRTGWLPSIAKSRWLVPEDLPTQAWTERVIASMRSDATKFAIDHARIPAISRMLMQFCAVTMTWQRNAGELGDAHRIADQLVALAERLTQSYPDQAVAYILLSEGYVQKAKIAYRDDDESVIEGWERKALDAATRAAAVEPDKAEARNLVKDRHNRLRKITGRP